MSVDITLVTVFFAGVISFLSPCVLPLVPPYLTYLAGVSVEELSSGTSDTSRALTNKILLNALMFVGGFTIVFVSLGAGASTIGVMVRQYSDILSVIAGLLIITMGLHFIGIFRIALLYREARYQVDSDVLRGASLGGSFLMGLAFAFGWTPCIGPVLGAILGVAGSRESVGEGAGLLALYSAGLGVPFLIAALFAGPFMTAMTGMKRHMRTIEIITGVLLVVTGLLFLTGGMEWMAYTLLEAFPALQQFG